MTKKLIILLIAVGTSALFVVSMYSFPSSAAKPQVSYEYEITYLPLGDFVSARVNEINDKNVMVGSAKSEDGTSHAVKWEGGEIVELPSITELFPDQEYVSSSAVDINDKGQILGSARKKLSDGSYKDVNVIWDENSINEVIQESGLVCTSNGLGSWLTNSGEIVGTCSTQATGNTGEGFILKDGVRSRIGTLYGVMSIVEDVSKKGHIVGFSYYKDGSYDVHPFMYYKGAMTDLMPGQEASAFPFDVNENGEVVGYSNEDGFYSGFLYNNQGVTKIKEETDNQYVFNLARLVDTKGRVYGSEQILNPYGPSELYLFDKGDFYNVDFEDTSLPEEVNKDDVFIGNVDGKPAYWEVKTTPSVSTKVLETLEVSSRSYYPVYSDTVLEEGRTYLVEVSGTYIFVGNRPADAEFSYYSTTDAWTESLAGGTYEEHVLDLLVNDQPQDWLGSTDGVNYAEHTFSPDHTYRLYVDGEGESLSFFIYDLSNDGNSGSLTVSISEVVPKEMSDCENGGWMNYFGLFENQGMCVKSLR